MFCTKPNQGCVLTSQITRGAWSGSVGSSVGRGLDMFKHLSRELATDASPPGSPVS
mgnify:CR=1 FL=1